MARIKSKNVRRIESVEKEDSRNTECRKNCIAKYYRSR